MLLNLLVRGKGTSFKGAFWMRVTSLVGCKASFRNRTNWTTKMIPKITLKETEAANTILVPMAWQFLGFWAKSINYVWQKIEQQFVCHMRSWHIMCVLHSLCLWHLVLFCVLLSCPALSPLVLSGLGFLCLSCFVLFFLYCPI